MGFFDCPWVSPNRVQFPIVNAYSVLGGFGECSRHWEQYSSSNKASGCWQAMSLLMLVCAIGIMI